jgi:repressor LexA
MNRERPTTKERELLTLIARHLREHLRPPTQTEAARQLQRSQGTIHNYLKRLSRQGYLDWTPHIALGIGLTEKGWQTVGLDDEAPPIVSGATPIREDELLYLPELGTINAGPLDEQHQDILGFLPWPTSLGARSGCFVLRVNGDSMVDAHIHPGSRVILDPHLTPQTGDIVAVLLNGDCTLKRLHYDERGSAVLLAENSHMNYPPIVIRQGDDAKIQGVVIHIVTTPDSRRRP